jgi:DNA modification methylase
MNYAKIFVGDNRQIMQSMPNESVQCVVTSPPYWGLRDYGHDGQFGLENSPEEYIESLCLTLDEVKRVLRSDGTLWLNLGDSYHKKSLAGIPWRVALALKDRGWFLRSEIIWAKPNPMPEPANSRPAKSHEHIFLLAKSDKYYYDHLAVRERGEMVKGDSAGSPQRNTKETHGLGGGNTGIAKAKQKLAEELATLGYSTRNKRDVWTVQTRPYKGAHFATYPTELIVPCILAGTKEGDIVLDPFSGSGTTGEVALLNNRNYIGIELNPEYAELSKQRLTKNTKVEPEILI